MSTVNKFDDSIIFYQNRHGEVVITDSESLLRSNDPPPALLLAKALANAGYRGVQVEESIRPQGDCFFYIEADPATPEGRVFESVCTVGNSLPSLEEVLEAIKSEAATLPTN